MICKVVGKTCESIREKYFNITLRFTDKLGFHLPPSSYLKTINGNCHNLVIYSPKASSIILGDVFIENFYIVYDYESSSIGFNGWVELELPVVPPRPPRKSHTKFTLYIVSIVVIFVATITGIVIYCRRTNKLSEKLATENLLNGEDHPGFNINTRQRATTYH